MSLRREIHSAFEVITPPLGGMPERVVQTVLAQHKGRQRKERMVTRLRISVALVAAVLLVAVAVAAIISWNSSHNNVAPAGVGLTPLQQLEARPIRLQVFNKSVLDCKTGPYNAQGSFGAGPIYGDGGSAVRTNWGEYFYNVASADTVISGPIIVRVEDVYKKNVPMVFVGPFAGGPTVGTDVVDGTQYKQHTELVLDENQVDAVARPGWPTEQHRFVWDFLIGIPGSASGGTGWQIDGPGFSEIFYAC
ncbi:MAG TPA: hypothetical protein VLK30_05075 [Candidatus Limnocylindrales bacterium]|nr:hypothetical protein [Candidatus Limnocylindrales bacterium]